MKDDKWLDIALYLVTLLAITPLSALAFMFAYSLVAPVYGWPALDYLPAFGLMLMLRIVMPPYVVRSKSE